MNDPTQVRESGYCPGLTLALRAIRRAERRKPTDDDAPPLSTFPMTPAARAALMTAYDGKVPPKAKMRARVRQTAQTPRSA